MIFAHAKKKKAYQVPHLCNHASKMQFSTPNFAVTTASQQITHSKASQCAILPKGTNETFV